MEEKSLTEKLSTTLTEISMIEVTEISLLIAIVKKNVVDLINKNMKKLNDEFLEKCEFYGKSISQVNSEKEAILNSYKEEFDKIATKFEEEYMNLAIELQEVQASQKITIANMKKVIDLKNEYLASENSDDSEAKLDVYNRKIDSLADKYVKYCGLEEACIIKLKECNENIEKIIESVISQETSSEALTVVEDKKSIFSLFSKIFKIFSKNKSFEREYIFNKKQNLEKTKIATNAVLEEIDKQINDSLIILDAYNAKINQICN